MINRIRGVQLRRYLSTEAGVKVEPRSCIQTQARSRPRRSGGVDTCRGIMVPAHRVAVDPADAGRSTACKIQPRRGVVREIALHRRRVVIMPVRVGYGVVPVRTLLIARTAVDGHLKRRFTVVGPRAELRPGGSGIRSSGVGLERRVVMPRAKIPHINARTRKQSSSSRAPARGNAVGVTPEVRSNLAVGSHN